MYPRNAASPEPIAIGPVLQTSDGAVQSSGVTVRIKPVGVAEADGGGTTAYSTDGVVLYTPTQGETNYTSFVLIAKKTGCIPASVTVVTTASTTAGYAGLDWGKVTAATTAVALTNTTISASQVVASVSGSVGSVAGSVGSVAGSVGSVTGSVGSVAGSVGSVTSPVTVGTNNDKTGYSLATAPPTADAIADAVWDEAMSTHTVNGSYGSHVVRSANHNRNTVAITVSQHVAADIHDMQAAVITADKFAANWLTAAGTAADYITELQTALGTATNQTAIKTVTDRLNTGLVLDGAVYQFTVNMLENAPGGGGGGSATLENQQLILANLDNVTGAVSAAVARLQLETQITGFPATICRGSDYDTTLESEIRLQLLDLENNPITEIGGTPVAEITWLFGFGTDRQPRLVAGACSWDDTTDELVIELAADDTDTTPLGSVTWQIGAQIGELVRWLGGGTTRIVERQFTT